MLELGCGGGNLASHLTVPELVLTDLSEDMLRVSRRINPGREHVQGDMRTLRLGRRFDAVLVHDAIDYMLTEDDLAAALGTVAAHLAPGGAAVLLPDATPSRSPPARPTAATTATTDGESATSSGSASRRRAPPPTTWTSCSCSGRPGARPGWPTTPTSAALFPQATWDRLIAAAGLVAVDASGVADPWPGEHVPMVVRPA